jgi:hypothetical protein
MWRVKFSNASFGWLSYDWTDTLRSVGNGFYPADFSQPHVVNAVFNTSVGESLELGARYRLASGIPYTPIASRSLDSQGNYTPSFGPTNSERLDWYQRLDLRAQYEWRWRHCLFRPFLEVYNATNSPNVTSVTYKSDYSGPLYVKQFPRFFFVGMELEF